MFAFRIQRRMRCPHEDAKNKRLLVIKDFNLVIFHISNTIMNNKMLKIRIY